MKLDNRLAVYRSMTAANDDAPEIGGSARTLGVRVPTDIEVDAHGNVQAGFQGMSVSPFPIENLPKHRRPVEFGGTGKDPVWGCFIEILIKYDLSYVIDPNNDGHGFIAPRIDMPYTRYEENLYRTKHYWFRVTPESINDEDS